MLNDHEFAGASSSGIPEHGFSGTVLLNKKCNNHREMTVVDLSSDSADCHDDVLQNCDKLTSIATPPRDNVSIIDRVGKRRRVDHVRCYYYILRFSHAKYFILLGNSSVCRSCK